nr:hypothetical protein [Bradyrhizobium sp. 199]
MHRDVPNRFAAHAAAAISPKDTQVNVAETSHNRPVLRVGGESWIGDGAREKPETFVKRTFDAIRAILK